MSMNICLWTHKLCNKVNLITHKINIICLQFFLRNTITFVGDRLIDPLRNITNYKIQFFTTTMRCIETVTSSMVTAICFKLKNSLAAFPDKSSPVWYSKNAELCMYWVVVLVDFIVQFKIIRQCRERMQMRTWEPRRCPLFSSTMNKIRLTLQPLN